MNWKNKKISTSGFPKVGGTVPLGAILVSREITTSKGAKGGGGDFKISCSHKVFYFLACYWILDPEVKLK